MTKFLIFMFKELLNKLLSQELTNFFCYLNLSQYTVLSAVISVTYRDVFASWALSILTQVSLEEVDLFHKRSS